MKKTKSNRNASVEALKTNSTVAAPAEVLPDEAFLAEAENEPKRVLLSDHIRTIQTLRDKKKFSLRAIADWFAERGIETDHSAIYRCILASTPEHERNPFQDWSELDDPDYGDENVKVKKAEKKAAQ